MLKLVALLFLLHPAHPANAEMASRHPEWPIVCALGAEVCTTYPIWI